MYFKVELYTIGMIGLTLIKILFTLVTRVLRSAYKMVYGFKNI